MLNSRMIGIRFSNGLGNPERQEALVEHVCQGVHSLRVHGCRPSVEVGCHLEHKDGKITVRRKEI